MRNVVTLFLLLFIAVMPIFGQTYGEQDSTILHALSAPKIGQGIVVINQSNAITGLIGTRSLNRSKEPYTQAGYRVQVFSGNNQNKSKDEAFYKESRVKSMFPETETYVTFKSPFWRLRIGNFRNFEEADQTMRKLKRAFPQFGKEMYVVKDEIKIEF
ncbi:MAG: SPOR domain-containing protein [Bacteroidales bacterium]